MSEPYYMELCACGHIRDEHHDGSPGVFGGCDMCRGLESIHLFEGSGRYGDMHPGLGHLVAGDWVYDEPWEEFRDRRFRRLFPTSAAAIDRAEDKS